MSKFTPAETVILKRLAHEAVNGMADPTSGEMFGPRQKPLTYDELRVLRRVIADAEVKRTGDNLKRIEARGHIRVTDEALKDSVPVGNTLDGLVAAMTPKPQTASKMPSSAKIGVRPDERIKTSQLLIEAANFIHNSKLDLQPSPPRGQDWRSFVRELRERAKLFRDIEDTSSPALPPPFGDGRDWELPPFGDGRDGDFYA